MDVSIYSACSKDVGMVRREVDVCDGSAMALQRMLDGTVCRILSKVEIPNETTMISRRRYPIIAGSKGRPLNINYQPWRAMTAQSARRVVRRIQIDDGKAFGSR